MTTKTVPPQIHPPVTAEVLVPTTPLDAAVYLELLQMKLQSWRGFHIRCHSKEGVRAIVEQIIMQEHDLGVFPVELCISLVNRSHSTPPKPFQLSLCLSRDSHRRIECYWWAQAQELNSIAQSNTIATPPELWIPASYQ